MVNMSQKNGTRRLNLKAMSDRISPRMCETSGKEKSNEKKEEVEISHRKKFTVCPEQERSLCSVHYTRYCSWKMDIFCSNSIIVLTTLKHERKNTHSTVLHFLQCVIHVALTFPLTHGAFVLREL